MDIGYAIVVIISLWIPALILLIGLFNHSYEEKSYIGFIINPSDCLMLPREDKKFKEKMIGKICILFDEN